MKIALAALALAASPALLACSGSGSGPAVPQEVPCTESSQCPSGSWCSLGLCTPGTAPDGAAAGDSDLAGDADAGDSAPAGCRCSELQSCVPAIGACLEPDICLDDEDCNAPRLCYRGACVAPTFECREDGDCQGGRCYAPTSECEPAPCTADGDCAAGRRCDAGSCAECLDDSDCPGTQICNGGSCFEAEPGIGCLAAAPNDGPCCAADADCLPGRLCTAGACGPAPCPADASEPNDGPADAAALAAGSRQLVLCAAEGFDVDWLVLGMSEGDGAVVRVYPDPAIGEVEAALSNDVGDILGVARQDGSVRVAALDSAPPAPVYLWVRAMTAVPLAVTVDVRIVPGGFCLPDAAEPNDGASAAADLGADAVDELRRVTLCDAADEDWFHGTASGLRTVEVTVTTQAGTPPAVDLYAGDAASRVLRDTTPRATKRLTYELGAGSYFIRIHANTGGGEVRADVVVATH